LFQGNTTPAAPTAGRMPLASQSRYRIARAGVLVDGVVVAVMFPAELDPDQVVRRPGEVLFLQHRRDLVVRLGQDVRRPDSAGIIPHAAKWMDVRHVILHEPWCGG